jgi:agmatine deiminase
MVGEAADAECDSARFCRSYVNSYLVNGGVIMPLYGTPSDEAAREVFRRLFPDRRIVGVPIGHIAIGGGGIHCITQQEPAARKVRTVRKKSRDAGPGSD